MMKWQRGLYRLCACLLWPFIPLRLLWRARQVPGYGERMAERFMWCQPQNAEQHARPLWIHSVSVGETIVALRLIAALREQDPDTAILLSTTTPTGAARAIAGLPADIRHVYMPYDFPWTVKRFLDVHRPYAVMMIEGEIWPELFWQLAERHIPVAIANARMSQRAYRRYQRFAWWMGSVWPTIDYVASQSRADGARYVRLGVPRARVKVLGNLKYDVALPKDFKMKAQAWRTQLCQNIKHVVVASSTHPGEDGLVLQAFQALCANMPNALLCLVPRHIERADDILAEVKTMGLQGVRRTDDAVSACQPGGVYVVDTMGELPLFYGAADVCFVGGSLVPIGGHNPIEPALAHCPVVVGPYLFNFTDMFRMLKTQQACMVVRDANALSKAWCACLHGTHGSDMANRAYVCMLDAQGVLTRYMAFFSPWLTSKIS